MRKKEEKEKKNQNEKTLKHLCGFSTVIIWWLANTQRTGKNELNEENEKMFTPLDELESARWSQIKREKNYGCTYTKLLPHCWIAWNNSRTYSNNMIETMKIALIKMNILANGKRFQIDLHLKIQNCLCYCLEMILSVRLSSAQFCRILSFDVAVIRFMNE